MAKPYSMDLRERAMRRVAAGESAHSVAAVLKVSVSSIIKWAPRQRRTGSVAPVRPSAPLENGFRPPRNPDSSFLEHAA